jgi:hypothetical protein
VDYLKALPLTPYPLRLFGQFFHEVAQLRKDEFFHRRLTAFSEPAVRVEE